MSLAAEAIDVVAVVGADLELTPSGSAFKGLCPFHEENTPSLTVTPERGTWKCFGCGEGGDAIDWLRKKHDLTYREALERLELPFDGVPVSAQRPVKPVDPPTPSWQAWMDAVVDDAVDRLWGPRGGAARDWLQGPERCLDVTTVAAARLGYLEEPVWVDPQAALRLGVENPKGIFLPPGIVIPCYVGGTLWYAKVREWPDYPKGRKYTHVRGGTPALYGAGNLAGHATGLLVEGEFDALVCHQEAGDLVGVATFGAASINPAPVWRLVLSSVPRWLVGTDGDKAGAEAKERLGGASGRFKPITWAGGKDPTEMVAAGLSIRDHLRRYLRWDGSLPWSGVRL